VGGDIIIHFLQNKDKMRNLGLIDFFVLNGTFSNISAISWRPVLVNQKQELSMGSVSNGIKIKRRITEEEEDPPHLKNH
jgi:hypothetical protein